MSGIILSEKHGVNPTIPLCFWCGKEKNELALLGKLKGDKEAPMRAVINYEPCDRCKEAMAKGVTIMQCQKTPYYEGQLILGGSYPSGAYFTMTEEAFNTGIKNGEKAFMLHDEFAKMVTDTKLKKESEEKEDGQQETEV